MSNAVRKLVWDGRWKAHVNARYFAVLSARYGIVAVVVNWLIAATASAAVVKWTIWTSFPGTLEALSAATALLSLFNATFGLPAKVATLADLRAKWADYRTDWDIAWVKVEDGQEFSIDELEKVRRKESELHKLEATFWRFDGLLEKVQDETCDALGIPRRVAVQTR
jgi:hypothetical protein